MKIYLQKSEQKLILKAVIKKYYSVVKLLLIAVFLKKSIVEKHNL